MTRTMATTVRGAEHNKSVSEGEFNQMFIQSQGSMNYQTMPTGKTLGELVQSSELDQRKDSQNRVSSSQSGTNPPPGF